MNAHAALVSGVDGQCLLCSVTYKALLFPLLLTALSRSRLGESIR